MSRTRSRDVLGIILFCLDLVSFLRASDTYEYYDDCTTTSENYLSAYQTGNVDYKGFTSLSQLNMQCDYESYFENFNSSDTLYINLYFDKMGILNETIDLNGFSSTQLKTVFSFYHVKGFDIEMKGPVARFESPIFEDVFFIFLTSQVSFFYRGALIDESFCNGYFFDKLDVQIFANLG